MADEKRPLKVFLCHASQDKPAVHELFGALKLEGWIDPWLDKAKILPGQDWRAVIEKAVEESDVVIVCLSNQSVTKEGFVQREIKYAYDIALEKPEETIFLIPLRLDDCAVPRGLRSFHWVNYFDAEKSEAYFNLLDALKLRYEQKLRLEEKERLAQEAIKKAAREKAERETAENIVREDAKREAAEKAKREKIERETAEKAAQEKAKHEAAEKVKLRKTERQTARKAALAKTLSNSLTKFKLALSKSVPYIRIIGIIGIIAVLFWGGSLAASKFSSLVSTLEATATQTSTPQVTFTNSPVHPTKTSMPSTTPTKHPTPTPPLEIGSTMISNKDGMILLYVPSGEFTMGSDKYISNIHADERPMHKVTLPSFWMDQTEVTNKMYALCVKAELCQPPNYAGSTTHNKYYGTDEFAEYPVLIGSDWNQAKTYCEWAGRRLPTEAEWEKAARGTDARIYPWGNKAPTSNLANYNSIIGDTTKVGNYPAGVSPYGVLDMAGNVWEWVSSLYKSYPYSAIDGRENLNTNGARVLRGGSWLDSAYNVRSGVRPFGIPPIDNTLTIGFRCARDANP